MVKIRPGNIQVLMYPGQVCNFGAGTRIPASPRFEQKEKILQQKQDGNKIVVTLAYLKVRCTKNHKFTQIEIQFC